MSYPARKIRNREGGQALIMVTLALISMAGMMGLAVDLGWSFFVRKAERVAADAAALGAVRAALANGGCQPGSTTCGLVGNGWMPSSAGTPCSSVTDPSLKMGCTYAANDGFNDGTGTIHVYMASDSCNAGTVGLCPGGGNPPSVAQPDKTCNGGGTCTVSAVFYVTATVQQTVPQLFSALTGNLNALVAARATAVISQTALRAQFTLTGRPGDGLPWGGTDLCIGGKVGATCAASGGKGVDVYVPGGIALASNSAAGNTDSAGFIDAHSTTCSNGSSGNCAGSQTPFTYINQGGGISGNTGGWLKSPAGLSDGKEFFDPMSTGIGQPPIASGSSVPTCNGAPATQCFSTGANGAVQPTINAGCSGSTACASTPTILGPGHYYTYNAAAQTYGAPVTLDCGGKPPCYFAFSSDSSLPGGLTGAGPYQSFSNKDYVIWGGLDIKPGVVVTFGPGRYVFAGVNSSGSCYQSACPYIVAEPGSSSQATVLQDQDPLSLISLTTGINPSPNNAGEVFIFTNYNYQGSNGTTLTPPAAATSFSTPMVPSQFGFGTSGICTDTGSCNDTTTGSPTVFTYLHGINSANGNVSTVDPNLANNFNGLLMWQDQANSYVQYTPYTSSSNKGGYVDTSCGGNINSPCYTSLKGSASKTPELDLPMGSTGQFNTKNGTGAGGSSTKIETDLWGGVYQPRGGWSKIVMKGAGGGSEFNWVELVSGALDIQDANGGSIILKGVGGLLTTLGTGLVE